MFQTMTMPPTLDPARHALFLDFDGTLVELRDDPQAVAIDAAELDRLVELQSRLSGALAVLSGRRIADLDRFLAPLRFAAAGVHGLERREAAEDDVVHLAGPSILDPVREALRQPLEAEEGLRLEDKGTALVVHYRGRSELKTRATVIVEDAVRGVPDLAVMHGHDIVEIHVAGMDKGRALASFMTHEPFLGRVPVYLGDDTTDEFAFAEVARLGGVGVKVGPGESAASHRLAAVDSVHRWLALEADAGGEAN
ncbi:trehalose-phosphatase [Aureimonas sp. AU4]|uniref:trehalose-phosphatase n=1 Tax=Aureimonas sp. AU4 TaxID=1638163 RepID=UPI0007065285|nr:trehalose-phosphatase [Aureimonas sp. AU4]BAT30491.1 trehalose 6-phosphate phosphatase [Aureimonas sp. AU4]